MRPLALALAAVLACACGSTTTIVTGSGGGSSGTGGGATGTGGGTAGAGGGTAGAGGGLSDGCPDESKTVYVLGADRTFSAFDPKTKTFRDVGVLACPTAGSPFSMSVARDAFAYVLYDNGELFKVSTVDLGCTATGYQPDATYRVFGMGFSTDAPGATTDTLFIAGGQSVTPMSKLGRLSTSTFAPSPGPDLVGWPELTGTGDAQLWGFFPIGTTTPFVARIDKTSGTFTTTYPAPELAGTASSWAFAFWGGSFWIFYQRDTDPSTRVWEMKASTGAVSEALADTGRTIVGAGVSTCAPIVIN